MSYGTDIACERLDYVPWQKTFPHSVRDRAPGLLMEIMRRKTQSAGGQPLLGDLETPVYPHSSLKPIQALPLVESGSADAFGLGDEEVALACALQSDEPDSITRGAAATSTLIPIGQGTSTKE